MTSNQTLWKKYQIFSQTKKTMYPNILWFVSIWSILRKKTWKERDEGFTTEHRVASSYAAGGKTTKNLTTLELEHLHGNLLACKCNSCLTLAPEKACYIVSNFVRRQIGKLIKARSKMFGSKFKPKNTKQLGNSMTSSSRSCIRPSAPTPNPKLQLWLDYISRIYEPRTQRRRRQSGTEPLQR